ncbi:MAG: Rieske 2Fe-2S domain-containing protein [Gemmatimonadota bacterium]|jgi:Rieske Fe-S protein
MTDEDRGLRRSLSRKRFVDWLLGTSMGGFLAGVLYPVVRYIVPPVVPESSVNSVTLNVTADDMSANSGLIFKFGNRPGLLIRTPSGELRAFSAVCTHLDCTVQYRDDLEQIWCACHNGHYDLNGVNVAGPPPRPLDRYDVNVRGSDIVVSVRT